MLHSTNLGRIRRHILSRVTCQHDRKLPPRLALVVQGIGTNAHQMCLARQEDLGGTQLAYVCISEQHCTVQAQEQTLQRAQLKWWGASAMGVPNAICSLPISCTGGHPITLDWYVHRSYAAVCIPITAMHKAGLNSKVAL